MSYKEDFKRKELEHELAGEDEDFLRSMSAKERKKFLREEAESAALRSRERY